MRRCAPISSGGLIRLVRTQMLEVLRQDYIRTARAKGLSRARIIFRHALRNASVPIVTVIGLGVALLIGGVVVTESVFTIPGLGRLTVDAVLARVVEEHAEGEVDQDRGEDPDQRVAEQALAVHAASAVAAFTLPGEIPRRIPGPAG